MRLLTAATQLFLEHGYERTSCEQVAALARARKASFYARYPNKAALFAAVIHAEVERSLPPAAAALANLPLRDRLVAVGTALLNHSLGPEALALMRLIIAEAQLMPDLARHADLIGWERGVRRVAEAIAGDEGHDAAAIARAWPAAARFIELVFVPHQMHALIGESPTVLAASARARIEAGVNVLEALGLVEAFR